ncbi:MAG TPA: hypothetical protein VKZ18_05740 [Polyangia bacterium]|nr:hypothetical protein [Polyangia bacterium]
MRAWSIGLAALVAGGCVGQTGGDTIQFPAGIAGPADAVAGQPLSFLAGAFAVVLTRATLHVGAMYLDQTAPVAGQQATGCYLTGTYVAQVVPPSGSGGLDVNLLDPTPQPFPASGLGITAPPAMIGQVWLTGGDINAVADTTAILVVAGTATQAGTAFPFTATVTIGANHQSSGTGTGGGDPICKQRIVTPVAAALAIRSTGGLLLRVDPRLFFVGIDFGQLPPDAATGGYSFSDDPTSPSYFPTGQDLFSNLESIGPYTFSWDSEL